MTLIVSDFSDVVLPDLPQVPGMTSLAECRYLYWLTSSQLSGVGAVVEVGTWLGRSTLHIAAGLDRSGHAQRLDCFDGYTWGPADNQTADLPLKPGDSFQRYFEENVGRFGHLVTAHRTRIADITWSGMPIELLFLDAPKKLPEITRCLEVFGPALIAGKSIVAMQDYLFFPAYALAVSINSLRDHLEPLHVVVDGSTVGFRVTKPIDFSTGRPPGWNYRAWTADQVNEAWDAILRPLPASARERLEPGRALHLYDIGAKEAAAEVFRTLPMTPFQRERLARLASSHHYLGYPELYAAAGFPGTFKQNLLSRAKRVRDWVRGLRAGNPA